MLKYIGETGSHARQACKEDLQLISAKALDYCNSTSGLRIGTLPEIRFTTDLEGEVPRPGWLPGWCISDRERFNYSAVYLTYAKKILINDRNIGKNWAENDIERRVCHELVHYIRDINGLSGRVDIVPKNPAEHRLIRVFESLEESGPLFTEGVFMMDGNTPIGDVIRSLYNYKKDAKIPLETLRETYEIVSTADMLSTGNRFEDNLFNVIGFYGMDRRLNANDCYHFAGLNFAVLIYASNNFDLQKTAKKLITYSYGGLVQELKEAVRPDVKAAAAEISRIGLQDKRSS